jgi:chromosomal replication initiator protein
MTGKNINIEELWNTVLGELELTLSRASFTTWFTNTSIHALLNNQLVINVPNIFAKEWLEKKYRKDILNSVQKYHPEISSFLCQINQESPNTPPQKSVDSLGSLSISPQVSQNHSGSTATSSNSFTSSSGGVDADPDKNCSKKTKSISNPSINGVSRQINAGQIKPLIKKSPFVNSLNSKYTFDNFIVSSNNELANAACQSITSEPGKNYNPLFVYGGVGLGKTHLLQATGNKIQENFPHFKIRYVSMERFSNELVDAIQNNKAKEFKNKYIALDVLILDDIQFLSGKEKAQEEFFHVFESLNQVGKQVILSSDRPPKSIATLEDRLRSRFEGGMIVDVEKPDFETRLAIIDQKLHEKNFKLNKEVSEYLAKNIYHNIRELEGALNKIIVTFQFRNTDPVLDDVINLTKDIISINHQRDLNPEKIMEIIADYFNIKVEEIMNKCRKKTVVKPRQIAFYLLRSEVDMSYPEIGKFMGGRDHSTAIYAYKKIKKELTLSDDLTNQIKFIKEKLVDY